jgi:hypothetical protein
MLKNHNWKKEGQTLIFVEENGKMVITTEI